MSRTGESVAVRSATHADVVSESVRRARSSGLLIGLIALLIVPAWGGFDWLLEPTHARAFFELRLAADLPIALCLWLLWAAPVGRRRPELLTFLIFTIVQAEIAWMVVRATSSRDFYLLGFSLPLYASGCVMGGRSRWTALVVFTAWVSLGAALLTAPVAMPSRDLAAAAFYLTTASAIGWIGHLQRDRLSARELTARKHLEVEQARTVELLASLERLSLEDPLTELANRRRWDSDLATACTRVRRTGTELSILLIDVDRFKAVNDEYGHTGGDDALRDVAALLTRRVRAGDLVARIGGDEFAVLLIGASAMDAANLAEEVRADAAALRSADRARLSLSLGVAAASGPDAAADRLMFDADEQLYRAKATRNTVAAAHLVLASSATG
ncbi:MAG TPA: GGDEF domain-containing protein [Mycobacteriales bacterium]